MRKPARVLYLNSNGKMWGEGNSLLRLMEGLDRSRFEPVCVCGSEGPLTERIRQAGIPLHIVKLRNWRKLRGFWFRWSTISKLAGLIREESADLVHNNAFWVNPYGVGAARRTRIPAVVHLRDTIEKRKVRTYHLDRADRIIPVCAELAETFAGMPEAETRVRPVYNGVDLTEFAPEADGRRIRREFGIAEGEIVVVQVAQISPRKAQDVLVAAAKTACASLPGLRFLLVGGARNLFEAYEAEIQRAVKNAGLSDRFLFAGYRNDIPEILAASDVVALPSRSEGFPRSILEAMAAARPVIASDVKGNREAVVPGETGLLFPSEDSDALAAGILELARDPERRKAMGEAAGRRVRENFSIERNVEDIQSIYEDLLFGRS